MIKKLLLLLSQSVPANIWQPGGIALEGSVTTDENHLQEPSLLYEGNAQVLSDTVFKMWYSIGKTNRGIAYAESTDGLVWTRYNGGAPVLSGGITRCFVMKVSSTYIMFALGSGGVHKYTSSDGLSWTDAGLVLAAGGVGTWDNGGVNNTFVLIDTDDTWLMFYDGSPAGGGSYKIGLARSTDEGATWTKDPANPLVLPPDTQNPGSAFVTKINNTYHLWEHEAPSGGLLPTDLAHYYSTDLVTWTRNPSGFSFPRVDRDEGYTNSAGQVADLHLIEVNNRTYMYFTGMRNGSLDCGRIKVATAELTLAEVAASLQGVVSGYKPEIMYNQSFESAGTGGTDVIDQWTEAPASGTVERTTTAGEFRAGTSNLAAVKLTTSAGASVAQISQPFSDSDVSYVPNAVYKLSGWSRGDGVNRGRIRVFATTGGDLIPTWNTSPIPTTSTTYTYFEVTFTAPPTNNFSVILYSPTAANGVAYFDDLSLRQV